MNPFLAKSVRRILKEQGDHFSSLTIIIPNVRAGVFLKNEISKALDQPSWLPEIITMSDWIQQLTNYTVIDESDLLFELFDVHLSMENEQMEFNEFQSWASQLIRDFNEIDMALANADKLFGYINEIHALENWNPSGKEMTETQKNYLAFWKNLGNIYSQFNEHLGKKALAYAGKAYKDVADRIEDIFSNYQEQSIYFIGLNALTKAEEKIVYHLMKYNIAQAIWDADPYYLDNDLHEAGFFLRKHRQHFPDSFQHISDQLGNDAKTLKIGGLSGTMAQARYAGQLLKNIAETSRPEEIAIVLPDETLLFPLLESLPEEINSINVTMGYPVNSLRLFGFLKNVIELFSSDNKNSWSSSILEDILSYNYLSIIESKTGSDDVLQVRNVLRKTNAPWVNLTSLNKTLTKKGPIGQLVLVSSSHELVDYLLSLLQQLKEYFESKQGFDASIEQESIFLFIKLTRRLKKLVEESTHLNGYQNVLSVFKILVQSEKINFKGEPLAGIQIMGMLETRLLDFEHVIMLSMNEGIFPTKAKHSSFIPYDVRKTFGLNTQMENDAIYAYYFYRLLQGAKNATFLYNTLTDQFNSDEKSRFLLQLEHELGKNNPTSIIHTEIIASPFQPNEKRASQIRNSEPIKEILVTKLSEGISPSSIIKFLQCPLDFYYRYIVGLKDRPEDSEFLDSSEIGNAIHLALFKFYEPWIGEFLNIDLMKSRIDEISMLVDEIFAKRFSKKAIETGKLLIAVKMVKETIRNFVDADIARLGKVNHVKLVALEEKIERPFQVTINGQILNIRVHGVIDRIEQHGSEKIIFDYKSGSVLPTELTISDFSTIDGLEKKSKAIQLAIYAWLSSEGKNEIVRAGIIPLKTNQVQIKYASIQGNENISEEWTAIEDFLKTIISAMHTSDAYQHSENSRYCNFCA